MTRIAIVDFGNSGAPDFSTLVVMAGALQKQWREHFAPAFGLDTTVAVEVVTTPSNDDWVLGYFKDPDEPGALGYHGVTPSGLPFGKVFPLLDAEDGAHLSTTTSHEMVELGANSLLGAAIQANDGRFWAFELADAVEQDEYSIGGVPVSNFCLPTWFSPPSKRDGVKYDFLSRCSTDHEIRPGGYGQWSKGAGWHMVEHHETKPRSYRRKLHAAGHSRLAQIAAIHS